MTKEQREEMRRFKRSMKMMKEYDRREGEYGVEVGVREKDFAAGVKWVEKKLGYKE